jgi:hypothetical protein
VSVFKRDLKEMRRGCYRPNGSTITTCLGAMSDERAVRHFHSVTPPVDLNEKVQYK